MNIPDFDPEKLARKYPKLMGCRVRLARTMRYVRCVGMYKMTVQATADLHNKCERVIRREIDWMKGVTDTESIKDLIHKLHAWGLGFCNENAKQDYLKREEDLRKAS